jgi:hypothetical protein
MNFELLFSSLNLVQIFFKKYQVQILHESLTLNDMPSFFVIQFLSAEKKIRYIRKNTPISSLIIFFDTELSRRPESVRPF